MKLAETVLSLFEEESDREIKDKIIANNDKMDALKKAQDEDGEDNQDEIDELEAENDELNDGLGESVNEANSEAKKKIKWHSDNIAYSEKLLKELTVKLKDAIANKDAEAINDHKEEIKRRKELIKAHKEKMKDVSESVNEASDPSVKLQKLKDKYGQLQADLDSAMDIHWDKVRSGKNPSSKVHTLTVKINKIEAMIKELQDMNKEVNEDDYTKQRNEIDAMLRKVSQDRKDFYREKLAKMDKREGGSHRIGITGIHSMIKKELGE